MKKTILILSALFFMSCSKDKCFLYDSAFNNYNLNKETEQAWSEYLNKGKAILNGIEFDTSMNPLFKTCN